VSERRIRALREAARRSSGRLADHSPRRHEGALPAARRRADLERSSQRQAARVAAAEAGRRSGPEADDGGGPPNRKDAQ
jgi:hypothetical protein